MTHQRISRKGLQRPDLTPMVSIAFLLMAFFMVQANMKKPQIIPVLTAGKEDEGCYTIKEKLMLTLLLSHEKVYYYQGISNIALDSCDFSPLGLRALLLNKKRLEHLDFGYLPDTTLSRTQVYVKACPDAHFKNLVDALDELKICGFRINLICDISNAEMELVKHPEKGIQYFWEF